MGRSLFTLEHAARAAQGLEGSDRSRVLLVGDAIHGTLEQC